MLDTCPSILQHVFVIYQKIKAFIFNFSKGNMVDLILCNKECAAVTASSKG